MSKLIKGSRVSSFRVTKLHKATSKLVVVVSTLGFFRIGSSDILLTIRYNYYRFSIVFVIVISFTLLDINRFLF